MQQTLSRVLAERRSIVGRGVSSASYGRPAFAATQPSSAIESAAVIASRRHLDVLVCVQLPPAKKGSGTRETNGWVPSAVDLTEPAPAEVRVTRSRHGAGPRDCYVVSRAISIGIKPRTFFVCFIPVPPVRTGQSAPASPGRQTFGAPDSSGRQTVRAPDSPGARQFGAPVQRASAVGHTAASPRGESPALRAGVTSAKQTQRCRSW